jgi:hypothetical protein
MIPVLLTSMARRKLDSTGKTEGIHDVYAQITRRVAWAKQLTDKEAKDYTLENIFSACNNILPQYVTWFQQLRSKAFEWPAAATVK